MTRSSKRKKNRLRRAAMYLLIVIGIAGIAYSGYRIFGIQAEYDKGDQVYDQLRREAAAAPQPAREEPEPDAAKDEAAAGTADEAKPAAQAAAEHSPAASGEAQDALVTEADFDETALRFDEQGRYLGNDGEAPPEVEKPKTDEQPKAEEQSGPVSVMDFARLRELNPDTVAWITFDDGVIDYPIVQGDNNKFYLTHLFNREYGKAGTIFIDVTNAADFSDKNTLIFGHHMNNGSMFANVEKYQTQEYYEQYPTMELYTPQGDGTVEWFAGYAISAHRLPTNFETEEDFLAHVDKAKEKSHFKTDVEVGPQDRIVTLVTCTYGWEDARYILLGVIREGAR